MATQTTRERAARKRADRKKRRRGRAGDGDASEGGLMMGMRGGFKSAVRGRGGAGPTRRFVGWLPIVVFIVALLFVIRRMNLF